MDLQNSIGVGVGGGDGHLFPTAEALELNSSKKD